MVGESAIPLVSTAASLAVNLAAIDTVNRVVSKKHSMRKSSHRSRKKGGSSTPAVFSTPKTPKATSGLGTSSKHARNSYHAPKKAFGKGGLSGREKGKLYGKKY